MRAYALHWEPLQQLIDLLIRHLLPQLRQDVSQLSGANKAVPGLVEDLEAFDELVCIVSETQENRVYQPESNLPAVPAGFQPS